MTVTLTDIALLLGIVISMITIIGLSVRIILVPYLREHLVKPMARVRDQVENSHDTNLRDDLDDKFLSLDESVTGTILEFRRAQDVVNRRLERIERTLERIEH